MMKKNLKALHEWREVFKGHFDWVCFGFEKEFYKEEKLLKKVLGIVHELGHIIF